jgi:CDP-diacylglycerol--glycerol-3-phosphate 3-phosphatidyltransferase
MMMNALDGMLAREYNKGTVAGEIANEALDIVGDTICYGILYFVPDGPRLSLVILLLLSWAAEFFGVLGKGMPGGIRRHETFLGGKPDRAVWMGLMAIISFFYTAFEQYIHFYLYGVSFLVFLTCVLRIHKTIEVSKEKKYESYTWIGR